MRNLEALQREAEQALAELAKYAVMDEGKQTLARLADEFAGLFAGLTTYKAAIRQLDFRLAEVVIERDISARLPRAEALIRRCIELMNMKIASSGEQAREAYERSKQVSILFCLLALGATFLLAWLFTRSLTIPHQPCRSSGRTYRQQ